MKPFLLIIVFYLLTGCVKEENNFFEFRSGEDVIQVCLEQVSDSTSCLSLQLNGKIHSEWPLNYPVFCFDYGDVTGNGIPDIGVGVIKGTRFFPEPDKRPFLFQITEDYYIRPLWLGSRVAQPLENFRLIRSEVPAVIRTRERERNGHFLVAEYRWRGFGIEFIRYLARDLQEQQAEKLLQSNL